VETDSAKVEEDLLGLPMPKPLTWGQLTRPAKAGVLFSLGVLAIVLGFCVLLLAGFFGV
jgi:hypothetical protein